MGSIGDFHTHSTYSDGKLTPSHLAEMAHRHGVRVMALTDHDTTAGLADMAQALSRYPEISLVPGVELSTDIPGSEIHVLGYFMDVEDQHFQQELSQFREGRLGRGQEMVRKLRDLGMDITWERVQEIAGDASVGRPHVAQALLERGYVKTIAEAFDRFIGRDGPAYAERDKLTPEQAIELIRSAGGLAFFAHPSYTKDIESVIPSMKQAGLTGMEVYYRSYPPETVEWLRTVAERYDLMPLGGSDFHGLGNEGDREIGDIPLPEHAIDRFLQAGAKAVARRSGDGPDTAVAS
jgi:predicted metal-dependent phosphoesterase TrpH